MNYLWWCQTVAMSSGNRISRSIYYHSEKCSIRSWVEDKTYQFIAYVLSRSLLIHGGCLENYTIHFWNNLLFSVYRNLLNNPLNCDCHMKWFAEWLRVRSDDVITGIPVCTSPAAVQNSAVSRVSHNEFICPGKKRIEIIHVKIKRPSCMNIMYNI